MKTQRCEKQDLVENGKQLFYDWKAEYKWERD